MKKIISILLVVAMLLTMTPFVFAATVLPNGDDGVAEVSVYLNGGDEVNATAIEDTTTEILVPITIGNILPRGVVAHEENTDKYFAGLQGISFKISYDNTKLALKKVNNSIKVIERYDDGGWVYSVAARAFAWTYNADTMNTAGSGYVYWNAGADTEKRLTKESFDDAANLFCTLVFTKVNADDKGKVDVMFEEVTGATLHPTDDSLSYTYKDEYFNKVNTSIKFSETYAITEAVNDSSMGSVVATVSGDKTALNGGEEVTVTATPNDGYVLDTLTYNGTEISVSDNVGTFTMPSENTTVLATFKPATYNITYVAGNEFITVNNASATAAYGSTVTAIGADVSLGYKSSVDTIEIKKGEEDVTATVLVEKATGKFTMPAGDVTVIINGIQSLDKGNITATKDDAKYEILNLPTQETEGEEITFTVNPEDGYDVAVSATGASLTDNGNKTYTFTMPDNDVAINVVATPIERPLTGGTITVASALSSVADIDFGGKTTTTIGETVNFTITPKNSDVSLDKTKIVAKNSAGADIINWGEIALMNYGWSGSFVTPADGVVTFALADGETSATLSADASLTNVTIGYQGNVDGTQTAKTETVAVSNTTTLVTLANFADPDYGDNFITITPAVAANATYEVLYGDAAYTNNLELGTTTEEFKIKVTAQDGKTTKTYTLKVKNATDPDAGATIEFVATPNLSVAKGSSVTVSILAKGLQSYGTTGLDLEIVLPKAVILNNADEFSVDVHEGAGIVNAMNTLTYDETTGILKIVAVTTNADTQLADTCEVAVVTFTVDPETTATKLVIGDTGSVGSLGNGQQVAAIPMTVVPAELDITANMVDVQAKYIEEIENYVDERDYTVETWEEEAIDKIAEIIEEILLTETPADTEAVVAAGKAELDAIQTLVEFKDEISTDDNIKKVGEADEFKAADYTTEDWAAIEAIVDEAQANIAASGSREEDILNGYVLDAQAKIAEVAELDDRIAEAQAKIVVDESKYTDEALADEVATAITEAKTEIAGCTTTADMDVIVDAFLDSTAAPGTATAEREATDKITENIYTLDALTTLNPETNAKDALVSVTVEKAQSEKTAYLGKAVDDVLALTTSTGKDLYTAEAKAKIEIYELIAQAKIEATTSEVTMNAAIDEALAKIAAVPTVTSAADEALKKISTNDKTGYDIEDIVTTTVDNVDPAKEALYEAAIEAYKEANEIPGDDPANPVILTLIQLQGIIDDTNLKIGTGPSKLGDFTCNGSVDIQDPTGTMRYVCNKPIEEYIVGAQNILNADLHTPGDGVLTVFDVVEIMKLL